MSDSNHPRPPSRRLDALRATDLLDTAAEEPFDRLARLAARFLHAPVAQVNLIDRERQFSKSSIGPGPWSGPRSVPLEASYCKHVVSSGEPLVIEDAREHPLVRDNPATTESGIVAYAAVPLTTENDHTLGTLCVVDFEPRRWSEEQIEVLRELAASVMTEIALRQDIAERIRVQQALEESERRFRQLAENIREVFWIYDLRERRTAYVSPAFDEVWGRSWESLQDSRAWMATIYPMDRDRVGAANERQNAGEYFEVEYRIVRPDGETRWIWDRGFPVRDSHGRVDRVVGIAEDVTERKQVEEVLQTAQEVLEERVRERTAELERANAKLEEEVKSHARTEEAFRTSEERLRLTLEQVPAIIWTTDPELRITSVKGGGLEALGIQQDGIVGMSLMEYFQTDDPDFLPLRMHREALGGEPVVFDFEWMGCTFFSHVEPLRTPTGKFLGTLGIALDITERMEREEALRRSRARFRALVENIGEVITILDPDGSIRYESPAVGPVLGYAPKELVGRNAFELVHPDDLAGVQEAFGEALQNPGRRVPYRIRFRHRDGSWRLLEGVGTNLLDNPAIQGVVATSRDVTEHRKTERLLRESERHFHRLVESVRDYAIFTLDPEGRIVTWNPGAERITGYAREEVLGQSFTLFYREEDVQRDQPDRELTEAREMGRAEGSGWRIRKDGSEFWGYEILTPLEDSNGFPKGFVKVVQDVTERKEAEERLQRTEEQLRQAQKMEAVGRLAGGIAHDFNNMLTAIKANVHFLLQDLPPEDPSHEDAEEIKRAADRAAMLTGQLLAFSRQQVLQPRVLDLNELVGGIEPMLRRLISEDIELVTRLDPTLGRVEMDPGQFEQVLMNLVVNARDAMPRGGKLVVRTQNAELDEEYASDHGYTLVPGEYVMLSVSDTGEGMSREVQEKIFEPFFTTKEQGKGTGLGLSTVYGIVKQSEGYINVYSEEGRGSTFRIYLPRVEAAPEPLSPPAVRAGERRASATILLVEDDPVVRKITRRVLEREGHAVLGVEDVEEALRVCGEHEGPIHLLITDVIMPGMNGRELSERVRALRPEVKVLFMSGYTDELIAHHGVLDPGTEFLQKPFGPDELARKVDEVLVGGE